MLGNNLITQKIYDGFRKLSEYGFNMNRLLDRQVSVIKVNFHMKNFQDFWHQANAHIYPVKFSDSVNEFIENYSQTPVIYDKTPLADEEYSNVYECVKTAREYICEIMNYCDELIKLCIDENKSAPRVIVEEYVKNLIPYISMYNYLNDVIKAWGYTPSQMVDFDNFVDFNHILDTYGLGSGNGEEDDD